MRETAFSVLIALLLVTSPATTVLAAGDVSFEGQVRLSGQPANNGTSYTYDLVDLDSASTPTAEFTGSTSTEWDNVTSADVSSGTSVSVPVGGDLDPTGPSTNGEPVVEITGTEQTTSWSTSSTGATSGSTKSVSVPGNVDPTSETVEFIGNEQTTARTVSKTNLAGGDSFSYTVNGNVPATGASVAFTGDSTTSQASASATGVSPTTSKSFSVGGNLEPTDGSGGNPTLTVTGQSSNVQYDNVDDLGDGTAESDEGFIGDSGGSGTYKGEASIRPDSSGTMQSVTIDIASTSGSAYNTQVDLYLVTGKSDASLTKDTKIKDGWSPSWSTGRQTITLDSAPNVDAGQDYHIEFVTTTSDGDGSYDYLHPAVDDSVGTGYGADKIGDSDMYDIGGLPLVEADIKTTPSSLSANVDNGGSANFGSLSDGETKSKTIDMSKSSSYLDISGSGGYIDYSLEWTERTATEDPSIDVDGDGSTDASYTGVLKSGQTHTASVSDLSTGSHTASVSTGHRVDVDVDMTERTATEDPGIDLDGDGVTDASYSGILTSGQSASVSAEALSNGDSTVETSLTAGTVDYTLSATGRTHTEDPSIDVGGDGSTEASASGIVSPGTTKTLELSSLSNSDSSATVSTTAGTADVAFKFRERQRSVDPAIIINGHRTGNTGALDDGQTVRVDGSSSWLSSGPNTVEVRVGETVGPDAPNPQVDLEYTHNATDRINQTYIDQKWSERYDVSKQFNSSQNDVTVELEHSGEIVAVRSLEYRINGNSWQELTSQAYELNGTTVRADLGDVEAGDQVDVRTAASKVQTKNGEITVEEPTAPGQRLDTAIRMDSWGSDSYIRVRGDSDLIRHTYNESWTGPDEYVEIRETGEQRLYMPDATSGSLARVSTIPVEANTSTGGVEVSVEDPERTEPEFVVRPGPGGEGDKVEFTYLNAQDDKDYILWSVSNEIVRDSGTANSPITLSDDDSSETLRFLLDDSGSAGGSGGSTSLQGELKGAASGAVSAGTSLSDVGIILVVGGLIAGAWVLSRQFGGASLSWEYLILAEGVVGGILALELLSEYSLAGGIAIGFARLAEQVGLGLAEAMPLALLVAAGLGYLAVRRWGRPQVVVNREFSIGGTERGENRK